MTCVDVPDICTKYFEAELRYHSVDVEFEREN